MSEDFEDCTGSLLSYGDKMRYTTFMTHLEMYPGEDRSSIKIF